MPEQKVVEFHSRRVAGYFLEAELQPGRSSCFAASFRAGALASQSLTW